MLQKDQYRRLVALIWFGSPSGGSARVLLVKDAHKCHAFLCLLPVRLLLPSHYLVDQQLVPLMGEATLRWPDCSNRAKRLHLPPAGRRKDFHNYHHTPLPGTTVRERRALLASLTLSEINNLEGVYLKGNGVYEWPTGY